MLVYVSQTDGAQQRFTILFQKWQQWQGVMI